MDLRKIKKYLYDNKVFLLICFLAFIYYFSVSVARHINFQSTGLDMAVFDQVFWHTVDGRFWEFSLELGKATQHSFWGNHFSPFLLFFVPIYFVFPSPLTLLALQAMFLTLGALPIYLFSKKLIKNKNISILIIVIYFLSPLVSNVNLFDFHEIAFFIPIFGFCLYFMFEKKWIWFWTFLTLSLSIKEEVGLIGLGLGVYLLINKEIVRGLLVSAVSLLWSYFAIFVFIPHFSVDGYKFAAYRYTDFGGSSTEIIRNIFMNPIKDLEILLQTKKVVFLLIVFGSVGFFSLLGGWLLITLVIPTLYLLLSSYAPHYQYTAQYSAVLIPGLFFTMVLGIKRIQSFRYFKQVFALSLLIAVITSFLFGAFPWSRRSTLIYFSKDKSYQEFERIKKSIPNEAVVASTDFLTSHLSQRQLLQIYSRENTAEYIFIDDNGIPGDQDDFEKEIVYLTSKGYSKIYCENICLLKSPNY